MVGLDSPCDQIDKKNIFQSGDTNNHWGWHNSTLLGVNLEAWTPTKGRVATGLRYLQKKEQNLKRGDCR